MFELLRPSIFTCCLYFPPNLSFNFILLDNAIRKSELLMACSFHLCFNKNYTMRDDNQQYALVTGGTSGIGYELVKLLAHDGYNLVIVARDENELNDVSSEIEDNFNVTVLTIPKDLFNPENAFEVHRIVKEKGIDISILINDAGQGQYGLFNETDIHRELAIINLNISSLVILTKLFLKDMVERRSGRIMNLSSIASKLPGPRQAVYHATKAFVQSFSEAIHSEMKDTGVTITALIPGATDTDFFNKAEMQDSKIVKEGKLDDPKKVAQDGYKAMMKGKDKVISGGKNKRQVAMAAITPDDMVADKLKKQQAPVSDENK
jgi:short-subunit dehydrogenase